MSWFDYFRSGGAGSGGTKRNANVARDRLQVIVAHQRAQRGRPDYLPSLQNDILAVIRKYVEVDDDAVNLNFDRADGFEVLELNVTLPEEG